MGQALRRQERFAEAEPLLRTAHEGARAGGFGQVQRVLNDLAHVLIALDRHEEAELLYEEYLVNAEPDSAEAEWAMARLDHLIDEHVD